MTSTDEQEVRKDDLGTALHGTPTRYNAGCRCLACRERHATRTRASEASKRYRQRKYAQRTVVNGRMVHPNPGEGGHGSLTAYTSYGCRCEACSTSMRNHQLRTRDEGVKFRRERWDKAPDVPRPSIDEQPTVDLARVFEW